MKFHSAIDIKGVFIINQNKKQGINPNGKDVC